MKHTYFGQVYEDEHGVKRVKPFTPDQMQADIQLYDVGDKVVLKIETFYRERTKEQSNVFHWYVGTIADYIGVSPAEMKELIRRKYLMVPMVDKHGNEVVDADTGEVLQTLRSTTSLRTVEMVQLCDDIRVWAMQMFGIDLPIPDKNYKLNFKKS